MKFAMICKISLPWVMVKIFSKKLNVNEQNIENHTQEAAVAPENPPPVPAFWSTWHEMFSWLLLTILIKTTGVSSHCYLFCPRSSNWYHVNSHLTVTKQKRGSKKKITSASQPQANIRATIPQSLRTHGFTHQVAYFTPAGNPYVNIYSLNGIMIKKLIVVRLLWKVCCENSVAFSDWTFICTYSLDILIMILVIGNILTEFGALKIMSVVWTSEQSITP